MVNPHQLNLKKNKLKLSVTVTLKKDVLDPQGKVVLHTLQNMGMKTLKELTIKNVWAITYMPYPFMNHWVWGRVYPTKVYPTNAYI